MTDPDRTAVSRSRTWAWRGLAILLLAPLAIVAAAIACAHQRWHARIQGVRFIDHPEMVRGGDAALTVRGYLVATVESDVDFFRMTGEDNGYPQVEASLCESGRPLRAWRDPLPLKQGTGASGFAYAVMVPMRAKDVDLSRTGEDVSTLQANETARYVVDVPHSISNPGQVVVRALMVVVHAA